jgi:uncharacterized protein (DUF433 family)
MPEPFTSPYLEVREGGYYLSGTRIGLDIIVREFQAGKSPEAILQSYPAIGSLARVYGAITFILEQPTVVQAYLCDQERLWQELEQKQPLSEDMLQRFYRTRELFRKSA